MNTEITFLIKTIQKELWQRWKLVMVLFALTAMAFLAAAWIWPKIYISSSVILVDQQSILSPLMQGTAVATDVQNRSKIARQVIFSQRAMEQVISSEVWAGDTYESLSPKEFEELKNGIQMRAEIKDVGLNLIEISFRDRDANKAHQTASLLTSIFITESIAAKQEESSNAYKFIDEQVTIYQNKLRLAEEAISEFRSTNVDATQGAKNNANIRLVELKREKEGVELEVSDAKSSILGNQKRLSGEITGETDASFIKENELELRITELKKRLDDLRLNYKESYPDIVQIKGQIEALQNALLIEANKREAATKSGTKKAPTGAIAQDLKRAILISEAKVISLNAKIGQLQRLIDRERETITQINAVEAEVAELNRDYTVNQTMYQDLLAQRENARVSMNMDIQNQGMTMKIQDPAILPVSPKGVRFLHIILAGLVLSIALPIGLVFLITLIDQKIRNEAYLRDTLKLPILAAVYNAKTVTEKRRDIAKYASIGVVLLATWSVYGYAIILKIQG